MKKKLSVIETISVASMLFGMFFGAGNLIFPVHLGQLAGSNLWPAFIGFIITGVGLPLLGDFLAQVSSLRLPLGHSGPVLTLSTAGTATSPCPAATCWWQM